MQSHKAPEDNLSLTSLPAHTEIPSTISLQAGDFQVNLGAYIPSGIQRAQSIPTFMNTPMQQQLEQSNAFNSGIFNQFDPRFTPENLQTFMAYMYMMQRNSTAIAMQTSSSSSSSLVLPQSAKLETANSCPIDTIMVPAITPPTVLAPLAVRKRKPAAKPRVPREKKSAASTTGPTKRQKVQTQAEKLTTRESLSELTVLRERAIAAESALANEQNKLSQFTMHAQQQYGMLQAKLIQTQVELEEKKKRLAEIEGPSGSSFYADTDTTDTTPGGSNDSTPRVDARRYISSFPHLTTPPFIGRDLGPSLSVFDSMPNTPILAQPRTLQVTLPSTPPLSGSFPFATNQQNIHDFYTHGTSHSLFFTPPSHGRHLPVKKESDQKDQKGEHNPNNSFTL